MVERGGAPEQSMRSMTLAGNRPVVLEETDAWLVAEGEVDVFVARSAAGVEDGSQAGQRTHLCHLRAGAAVFGMALAGGLSLVVVGRSGSRLEPPPPGDDTDSRAGWLRALSSGLDDRIGHESEGSAWSASEVAAAIPARLARVDAGARRSLPSAVGRRRGRTGLRTPDARGVVRLRPPNGHDRDWPRRGHRRVIGRLPGRRAGAGGPGGVPTRIGGSHPGSTGGHHAGLSAPHSSGHSRVGLVATRRRSPPGLPGS